MLGAAFVRIPRRWENDVEVTNLNNKFEIMMTVENVEDLADTLTNWPLDRV